jgi:hypothetical protein
MVRCDAGSASRMIDNDCGCHLLVQDVSVESQYTTSVKCKFVVLAATDPGQVGKEHTEFFSVEGKSVDKFYNVCEATGVITHQQRKAAADQGVGMDIDEAQLKGRQLCAHVKMEPNMRKNPVTGELEVDPEKPGPYPRIGFRSFAVTDAKAKDIPKDRQFLAMVQQAAGRQVGQQAGQVQATQVAPTQQQAAQAQSGSLDSLDW